MEVDELPKIVISEAGSDPKLQLNEPVRKRKFLEGIENLELPPIKLMKAQKPESAKEIIDYNSALALDDADIKSGADEELKIVEEEEEEAEVELDDPQLDYDSGESIHPYATRHKHENSSFHCTPNSKFYIKFDFKNFRKTRNRLNKKLSKLAQCPTISSMFKTDELAKYVPIFEREEIDFEVFQTMSDDDFKLLGLQAHDIELIRSALARNY